MLSLDLRLEHRDLIAGQKFRLRRGLQRNLRTD